MPLNTITITIQQVVHNTRGWDSVQVGEMTDLWLKVRDYFSIESGCIHMIQTELVSLLLIVLRPLYVPLQLLHIFF